MAVAGILVSAQAADNPAQPTASDAVRVLAREKSAAEQYAVVLGTIGKKDLRTYARGITLYADAKAEFDGLLEQLRFDLKDGRDPATSAQFNEALQGAARKRVAFTSFVTDEVVGKAEGGKPGLPEVIEVVPELVKSLTDAGLSIWAAFHGARKERQAAILDELEHLKWRSFADLAPA
jgi:hypothetical protein